MRRSRAIYLLAILVVIPLGLASRRYALPAFIVSYAGDTLWATMVYLIAAMVWNKARMRHLALGALVFAFAIELLQLYHAPWIEKIRYTRFGALVLGYGFLWSDFVCYTVGVCLGVLLDNRLQKVGKPPAKRRSQSAGT